MQRMHPGWPETARMKQWRQARRVLVDETLVGADGAGCQKLGNQRGQGGTDAVDLSQPPFGGHLFERLGRARHAARRATIGPQPVALFAGDFQALGDFLEESRDDQIGGSR
jgi:hypothetical protein